MNKYSFLSVIVAAFTTLSAPAQSITFEPDNFPSSVPLYDAFPQLRLYTTGANNASNFPVVAVTSTYPYTPPTGEKVFAHAGGVPFFYTDRRMRMDFNGLVSDVSIDFQSGDSAGQGRLEAYDLYGNLLATDLTSIMAAGGIETLSLSRPTPDIAWAIAYNNPGQGSFGRLDHLVFSEPIPEPSTALLFGLAIAGACLFRRLKSRGNFTATDS